MARAYLKRGAGTGYDYRRGSMVQQSNARCVRGRMNSDFFDTHPSETSIGEGAFGYDFGALENADNKLTRSFKSLTYGSLPL